jgi:hypothetical protein
MYLDNLSIHVGYENNNNIKCSMQIKIFVSANNLFYPRVVVSIIVIILVSNPKPYFVDRAI